MTDEITLDAPETRLERFLAAAAGVDGITLDEPVTRIEKYLYKIAQGAGGVPAVEDADKGKYLHANESTGDLEWATAGGGGSSNVLVVHEDADGVLDKTWQEIHDADLTFYATEGESESSFAFVTYVTHYEGKPYCVYVAYPSFGVANVFFDSVKYATDSASGYPAYTDE